MSYLRFYAFMLCIVSTLAGEYKWVIKNGAGTCRTSEHLAVLDATVYRALSGLSLSMTLTDNENSAECYDNDSADCGAGRRLARNLRSVVEKEKASHRGTLERKLQCEGICTQLTECVDTSAAACGYICDTCDDGSATEMTPHLRNLIETEVNNYIQYEFHPVENSECALEKPQFQMQMVF